MTTEQRKAMNLLRRWGWHGVTPDADSHRVTASVFDGERELTLTWCAAGVIASAHGRQTATWCPAHNPENVWPVPA